MKYHTKNLWWRDLKKSILQFIPMIGSHAFLKVLWWNIVHKSRGNIVLKIEQDHVNMKEWERKRERERERERRRALQSCVTFLLHFAFSHYILRASSYGIEVFWLPSFVNLYPTRVLSSFLKKKLCAHICIKDVNVIITAFISLPYIHVSA